MKKKLKLLRYSIRVVTFLMLSLPGIAQQKKISGIVLDANSKNALGGATVSIKNSKISTITKPDGGFEITVPRNNSVLVVSFTSYESLEIPVNLQTTFTITLKPSVIGLDDVVVIGYGTTKRKAVNGAVSSVKASDLNVETNSNFAQALAGRAPGLLALQSTGQPGASVNIQIRSNPSFASSGVLYVVDGVPINNAAGDPGNNPQYGGGGIDRSPLNFINPNDIESIEILKDASAASIYGAQAGAGVILITTKRGKGDKPRLEYGFSQAFQKQAKFYDLLGTKEYMNEQNNILQEAWLKNNLIAPYGNTDPSSVGSFIPKFIQQQIDTTKNMPSAIKAISQTGFVQQHNLSLTGTSGKTRYFVSGNYLDQQGVIRGTDYKRYNGRVNLDQAISSKIRVGVNINTSNFSANNQAINTGQNENEGIISAAIDFPGNLPFQNANGNYISNPNSSFVPNPLSYLAVTDKTVGNRLLTNGYGEWEIITGLKAKANFSYDQSTEKRSVYLPNNFLYGARANGQASIGQSNSNNKLLEYTLSYSRKLGKGQNINALAGYSYQVTNFDGLNIKNNDFLTDQFLYNNIGAGVAPRPTVGSYRSQQAWASYFGRAIYSLKEKYFLSVSVRRDGSSVFAKNKKFGYFPSFSAGWIVSEEPFFKSVLPAFNYLKLRASYGSTGNSNIGGSAFAYYATGVNYVFNNIENTGVSLSQVANPNLTWETVKEINLGLDYQLVHGRITGTFDYFNKTISNLLSFVPLTTDFPVTSVADNAGETRSKGWEIGLQSKNIVSNAKSGFEWNTSFTLSHFYSLWVKRSPDALKTLEKYKDPYGQFDDGAIYTFLSDGIYKGKGQVPVQMPGLIPGGIVLKDLNGYDANGNLTGKPDGQINSADIRYLGSSLPKLSFGFGNTFKFNNFDLSIYMYGITGGLKFNYDYKAAFGLEANAAFGYNTLSVGKQAWSSKNPNSNWPTGLNSGGSDAQGNSSFWYEKNDFIRCRDINLGYTFSSSLLQKQHIFSSVRLSTAIQNPFVITNYKGLDPELQNYRGYPLTKSIILALNVTF